MSGQRIIELSRDVFVELKTAVLPTENWVDADIHRPNCVLYAGYAPPELRKYMTELVFVPKKEGNVSITKEQLENWFTYHSPTPEQLPKYQAIREAGLNLATVIVENSPSSADQTAAIRKIREGCMTANAAIACGGQ